MYDDHYGFTDHPFQLTPDPRFWFGTASHRKAMSYLTYGLNQGEGVIVVTGDAGTGKTTLVGHLLDRVEHERLHVIAVPAARSQGDDVMRIVAAELGVDQPGATRVDLIVAIERGLHAVARSGRRTLLVIDDAQALPARMLEELRLLSNIAAGGHALLQIILAGESDLRERLEGPGRLEQLRQRVIALHHLEPMAPDEVEPYLAHRLALVGWHGSPRFTGDAFEALYRGSGGVPRVLNQLARQLLSQGESQRIDTIDGAMVAAAIADLSGERRHVITDADRIEWPPPADPVEAAVTTIDAEARLELVDIAARVAALEELPDPAEHPAIATACALAARVAALEARLEEQDASLRRVLSLLVDWVEIGPGSAPPPAINLRA